ADARDRTRDGKEEELTQQAHRPDPERGWRMADGGKFDSPFPVPYSRSIGFLELQLDVHEVVRRPRTGVLERQQLVVAAAHFFSLVVEQALLRAVDEEGGVQNHAVANDLVAAARDGDRFQRLVNVCDVATLH